MSYRLTLFDIDGTLIDKRALDDRIYAEVTQQHIGAQLWMMRHADGTPDHRFATKSNHALFAERLTELTKGGDVVRKDGKVYKKGSAVGEEEADYFVRKMGDIGFAFVRDNPDEAQSLIIPLLKPTEIKEVTQGIIGIGTAGSKPLQQAVLQTIGYFSHGINRSIAAYAEDSTNGTKEEIILAAFVKATRALGELPETVVYFGDSPKDMRAVKNLGARFYGVGVACAGATREELTDAISGRGIVIDTLASAKERWAARTYIADLLGF